MTPHFIYKLEFERNDIATKLTYTLVVRLQNCIEYI